jgi:hypothetical protein
MAAFSVLDFGTKGWLLLVAGPVTLLTLTWLSVLVVALPLRRLPIQAALAFEGEARVQAYLPQ